MGSVGRDEEHVFSMLLPLLQMNFFCFYNGRKVINRSFNNVMDESVLHFLQMIFKYRNISH